MQIISIVSCIKILKNVYNLTQVTTLAICLWINCLFLYYIWKYIYPISIEIHVTVSKFILHILRASSSSPVAVLASSFCTARRISYQSSRACFLLVNRVEVHYKSAWLTFSAVNQKNNKHWLFMSYKGCLGDISFGFLRYLILSYTRRRSIQKNFSQSGFEIAAIVSNFVHF